MECLVIVVWMDSWMQRLPPGMLGAKWGNRLVRARVGTTCELVVDEVVAEGVDGVIVGPVFGGLLASFVGVVVAFHGGDEAFAARVDGEAGVSGSGHESGADLFDA